MHMAYPFGRRTLPSRPTRSSSTTVEGEDRRSKHSRQKTSAHISTLTYDAWDPSSDRPYETNGTTVRETSSDDRRSTTHDHCGATPYGRTQSRSKANEPVAAPARTRASVTAYGDHRRRRRAAPSHGADERPKQTVAGVVGRPERRNDGARRRARRRLRWRPFGDVRAGVRRCGRVPSGASPFLYVRLSAWCAELGRQA